ncbi:DUF305 domain-containing protein [Nocardia higoensis]|uniref:DUF305 domain-containing protein n=1 Tax=Nocardia higoensis TaxID=228599 RepID=A0ABS0DA56_9NOCA|nr:DUF305 domain-containing protein [Nocardia higoensis]MBF6355336.1 DUF305 domain-containing protein [Nocardia higoensis]
MRGGLAVGAAVCTALWLFALGAAARPLLIADRAEPAPVLGPVEIAFVQDMTAHHQQALLLTQRLADDVDPTVRLLAQQVADTQRTELGMMLGWLTLARATVTNPEPMAWMRMPGHDHRSAAAESATMPGAVTQDELDRLAVARGRDSEVMFLRLMQRHHQGAVVMAQAADRLLSSGPVKLAARDMITSQGREAGLMGMMLARMQN